MADLRLCAVDGCCNPSRKRGWCNLHYQRWIKHGDPLTLAKLGRKPASEIVSGRKTCSKCGENKALSEFSAAATGLGGCRGDCKACVNERHRASYAETPQPLRAEQQTEISQSPRRRAWLTDYQRRNALRLTVYKAGWRRANQDKVSRFQRTARVKRLSNPRGKIDAAVSQRVRASLKQAGIRKAGEPTYKLLGYSGADLARHLERQFSKGMGWHNYGWAGWHIDHIIPLAAFTYASVNDPEFKQAWALSNLRPLWSVQNMSKGAKRALLL